MGQLQIVDYLLDNTRPKRVRAIVGVNQSIRIPQWKSGIDAPLYLYFFYYKYKGGVAVCLIPLWYNKIITQSQLSNKYKFQLGCWG